MDKIQKKCCICCTTVARFWQDIFKFQTKHSETPIFKILEQITRMEFIPLTKEDTLVICDECFLKIEEYDLAVATAQKIQDDFLSMLNRDEVEKEQEIIVQTIKCEEEIQAIAQEEDFLLNYIVDPPDIQQKKESSTIKVNKSERISYIDKIDHFKLKATEEKEFDFAEPFIVTKESAKQNSKPLPVVRNIRVRSRRPIQQEAKSSAKSTNRKNLTPIKCGTCFQEFLAKSEYKLHMKMHEDEAKVICYICGATYKSKSALAIHMGMHNGVSPFVCNICNKKFTQKGALVRHMPLHTGEKPYQCEKCGKQFIHYSSFHMHQLSHDDIRDKKCSICGLLLRSTSHLSRHMRVHSGEKPYSCPICGQKFAQRYNMTSHYKTHMGIHRKYTKTFECTICVPPGEFKYKKGLVDHMRTVHKVMDNAVASHIVVKNVTSTTADVV